MTEQGQSNRGARRAGWTAVLAALWLLCHPVWAAGAGQGEAAAGGGESLGRRGVAADRVRVERSQEVLGNAGALLGAARRASEEQDSTEAIWLLEQLIERHPVVGDYGAFFQLRLMQNAGDLRGVIEVGRSALARDPDSPLAAEVHEHMGDAFMALGESRLAQRSWRQALDESTDEGLRARVLLSIGAAEELSGLDDEAATTYRRLWSAYPTRPEAAMAEGRLGLLSDKLERSLMDGSAWRRRGDRFYRKRLNEAALDAYEQAVRLGVNDTESLSVARQRAHVLFRLRRYPEAVEAFRVLPPQDDSALWYARSLARADRVPESIEAFESLAQTARPAVAARARFLGATLLEGRGFEARARAHYMALSEASRASGWTDAALWRLGWMAYQKGNDPEAVRFLDQLVARQDDSEIDQLRARYWRARALGRLGSAAGQAQLLEIAREFPFSYYGWRARTRLVGEGVQPEGGRDSLPERPGRLAPSVLQRARILIEAGMLEEARSEIARSRNQARSLGDRLKLAHLATDAGDYNQAQRLVVDAYSGQLARGPIPRLEDLWWYAWPSAFSPEVAHATHSQDSVEPALVYSIMREESGYRPDVISPVGARGLLQIMTPTGEVLAQKQGRDVFDPDELFVPGTNISLGADYLAELSDQFDGRLSASIASYNAGPEAVREWISEQEDPEGADDEWVESIPYEQTRNYVKRVLRSLNVYRTLY